MKTVLEIGYNKYLLPASANVNQLIKILGEAKELRYEGRGNQDHWTVQEPPEVKVSVVKDSQIIYPKKPKLIAEKSSAGDDTPDLTDLQISKTKMVTRERKDS
jgi:hypothetical protein